MKEKKERQSKREGIRQVKEAELRTYAQIKKAAKIPEKHQGKKGSNAGGERKGRRRNKKSDEPKKDPSSGQRH